jgi:hypothetical protein
MTVNNSNSISRINSNPNVGKELFSTEIPSIKSPHLIHCVWTHQENLKEDLECPSNVSGIIITVRHGNTTANQDKDKRKSQSEPLSKEELEGEWYLQQTINEIKELWLDPKNIVIHVPAMTLRCIQSAQLIASSLCVPFPQDLTIFDSINTSDNYGRFIQDISNFLSSTTTSQSINIEKDYCYDGTPDAVKQYLQEYANILQQCLSNLWKSDHIVAFLLSSPSEWNINQCLWYLKTHQSDFRSKENAILLRTQFQAQQDILESQLSQFPVVWDRGLDPRRKGKKWFERTETHGNVRNEHGTESPDAAADRNFTYLMNLKKTSDPNKCHILVGHRYMEPAFAKEKYKLPAVLIPDWTDGNKRDKPANRWIIYQNSTWAILNQQYPWYVELSSWSNEHVKWKPQQHTQSKHIESLVQVLHNISVITKQEFYRPPSGSLIEQQNYINYYLGELSKILSDPNQDHTQLIQQIITSDQWPLIHLLGCTINENPTLSETILSLPLISQSAKLLFEHTYPKHEHLWMYCFGQIDPKARLKLEVSINDTKVQELITLYAERDEYLASNSLKINSLVSWIQDIDTLYCDQKFYSSMERGKLYEDIDNLIQKTSWIVAIEASWGTWKSTFAKKLIQKKWQNIDSNFQSILYITPTTVEEWMKQLLDQKSNQYVVVDGIDEMGASLQFQLAQLIKINKEKSCFVLLW